MTTATTPTGAEHAAMYYRMALARNIDIVMARHTREQRFDGWWHPGEGQEAAPLGATAALRPDE